MNNGRLKLSNKNKKIYIPIRSGLIRFILHPLQPRFLKRWYYKKSIDLWGHPSLGHWKYYEFWAWDNNKIKSKFWKNFFAFWFTRINPRIRGERDLWTGFYTPQKNIKEEIVKMNRMKKIDSILD